MSSYKIVTDENFLRQPCKPVTKDDDLEELYMKLFQALIESDDGIGLAANQIGIQKAACIINVNTPEFLINPRIVDSSGEVQYVESCLSFPGKSVKTKRFRDVVVEFDEIIYSNDEMSLGTRRIRASFGPTESPDRNELDKGLLECVAVQHELDHLNGKTMFDRQLKPVETGKKIGRNDPCPCGSGKKYKKCCGKI